MRRRWGKTKMRRRRSENYKNGKEEEGKQKWEGGRGKTIKMGRRRRENKNEKEEEGKQ